MKERRGDEAILYVRPGCPLCFSLRRSAARAARRNRLPLRIVDIRGDADLLARYDTEIPLLLLPGGSPPLQGRVPAGQVDDAFRRAARALPTAAGDAKPRRHGRVARLLERLLGGKRPPRK